MPAKIFSIFEWLLGYFSLGLSGLSFLFVMFTDNPHFYDKLTKLQNLAFHYHGLVTIGIILFVVGSFTLKFFFKEFPWSHLVGAVSTVSFFYFYIFFSAYFSKS